MVNLILLQSWDRYSTKRESPKTFREGLSTRCILNTWNNRLPHVYPEYGCAAYRAILTNHLFENASMVMSKRWDVYKTKHMAKETSELLRRQVPKVLD